MGRDSDDRLDDLAEQTAFDVEELRDLSDETVAKIEESLPQQADGDGTDLSLGGVDLGGAEDLGEYIEHQVDEALANSRRERLADAIAAQTALDATELPDDIHELESVADTMGVQVDPSVIAPAGDGGPVARGDGGVEDENGAADLLIGGHTLDDELEDSDVI